MGSKTRTRWACPNCGREFRNANQWHSCEVHTPEDHLADLPEHIQGIYSAVLKAVGKVRIDAVKSELILYSRSSAFAAIRPRRRFLRLDFRLDRRLASPRIDRVERISPNRIWNGVVLKGREEVDTELKRWLREAKSL